MDVVVGDKSMIFYFLFLQPCLFEALKSKFNSITMSNVFLFTITDNFHHKRITQISFKCSMKQAWLLSGREWLCKIVCFLCLILSSRLSKCKCVSILENLHDNLRSNLKSFVPSIQCLLIFLTWWWQLNLERERMMSINLYERRRQSSSSSNRKLPLVEKFHFNI